MIIFQTTNWIYNRASRTTIVSRLDHVAKKRASCLSETGRRCEKSAERGQILRDLQCQYRDIDQKAREIWPVQVILQPTIPVSDRLLDILKIYRMSSASCQCNPSQF